MGPRDEREGSDAREPAGEGAPREGAGAAALPAGAGPDAVQTEADVLEGELAARLQGLPPASDARFTTWRPGSGAPPHVEPAPPEEGRPAQQDPLATFFYRPDEEAPPVPELGVPAPPAAERDPGSAVREEYLTVLLGGEVYALAVERVREVMKPPPITEVPRAPPHVLGVVTVRGEVVAVFDPRRRLGLPAAAPEEGRGRIVIVDAGEGPCGLFVDAVASVVRLRPGSIEPCPQGQGGASHEFLAGLGREGDHLFTVLDLGALLRRAPPAPRPAPEGPDAGA